MRMEGTRAGPAKASRHAGGIHVRLSSCQDKSVLISSGDVINDGRFPELEVAPRLVAAADPVDQVRQEAVDNLGFERAYADYHDLLADPEVEAVSICAPNFLHRSEEHTSELQSQY